MIQKATFKLIASATPHWIPIKILAFVAHHSYEIPIRRIAFDLELNPSSVTRSNKSINLKRRDLDYGFGLNAISFLIFRILREKLSILPISNINLSRQEKKVYHLFSSASAVHKELVLLLKKAASGETAKINCGPQDPNYFRQLVSSDALPLTDFEKTLLQVCLTCGWIAKSNRNANSHFQLTQEGERQLQKTIPIEPALEKVLSHRQPSSCQFFNASTSRRSLDKPISENSGSQTQVNPIEVLARLKDRSGSPFLSGDLVNASKMFREDYELSNICVSLNSKNDFGFLAKNNKQQHAMFDGLDPQDSLEGALNHIGPELFDVVVRICCLSHGLSTIEKELGWSARSAKVVLRIALMQLASYYSDRKFQSLQTKKNARNFVACETSGQTHA